MWDILSNYCIRKVYIDFEAEISTALIFDDAGTDYLVLGFNDQDPAIVSYRLDTWTPLYMNVTHTKQITKLLQFNEYLVSGSANGDLCIHRFKPIKTLANQPHILGIVDIIGKNTFIYVLQKSSTVL